MAAGNTITYLDHHLNQFLYNTQTNTLQVVDFKHRVSGQCESQRCTQLSPHGVTHTTDCHSLAKAVEETANTVIH